MLFLGFAAIVLSKTISCKAAKNCSSDEECPPLSAYCCQRQNAYAIERFCRSDCVGYYCNSDHDCGDADECCNKMTSKCSRLGCIDECLSNADCLGRYCCTQRWPEQINVCRSSCVGQSCSKDSDCGGPYESCNSQNNVCTKYRFESKSKRHRILSAWKISVILICVFILLVFGVVVIYFKRKHRTGERGISGTSEATEGGEQVSGVNVDIQLDAEQYHGEGNHLSCDDHDALLAED